MIRSLAVAVGLFAVSITWVAEATARNISLAECSEGGEFIRNAALARENGVTREFFLGKLEEDLLVIRAFPPELRWFVQDDADEVFLSESAAKVFDEPKKPEEHEAAFIHDCLLHTTGQEI
jgi:hypothetical protein